MLDGVHYADLFCALYTLYVGSSGEGSAIDGKVADRLLLQVIRARIGSTSGQGQAASEAAAFLPLFAPALRSYTIDKCTLAAQRQRVWRDAHEAAYSALYQRDATPAKLRCFVERLFLQRLRSKGRATSTQTENPLSTHNDRMRGSR